MGLLKKCLDYLDREEKKLAQIKMRSELIEIEKGLTSPRYSKLLYPVNILPNYTMTRGMMKQVHDAGNNFPASLNAMGFFVAAIASELIESDIKIYGRTPFLALDSAIKEYKKRPTASSDDNISLPYANGSSMDIIWMKPTEIGLAAIRRTQDLLNDSHGLQLPQDVQEKIKLEYFSYYKSELLDRWGAHFKDSALEAQADVVISEFKHLNKKIWETTNVQLTIKGERDPVAIEALYNVRWSNRFWAGMPFGTIVNDKNFQWQLRQTWHQFFKPITMEEYRKQDPMEIMEKAHEIMSMAKYFVNKDIYNSVKIVPNHLLSNDLSPEEAELISSFGESFGVDSNKRPELCSKKDLIKDLEKIETQKMRAIAHALNMRRTAKSFEKYTKESQKKRIEELIERLR